MTSLASDAEDLLDGRVVDQVGKGFQDLNPALLDAAMSLVVGFREAGRRVPVPVDGRQGVEDFRWVALDREQVVRAMAAPEPQDCVADSVQDSRKCHGVADIHILQRTRGLRRSPLSLWCRHNWRWRG